MTEEYKDQDTLDPEGDEDALEPQGDESNEELAKLKEIAENQKIRAEKAERELKEMKEVKPQETPREDFLSQSDMIALIKEDIEDDGLIDEVKTFAKLKNITVKEALKSSVMRAVIAERKEELATAEATAIGNKRSGGRAETPEELISKARAGNVPETDDGIEKLVEARFQSKRKK
jgi:hypothetical protein